MSVTLRSVRVVDPASGSVSEPKSVPLGRLAAAGRSASGDIDCGGLFLMPGLLDMHVHATIDPQGRSSRQFPCSRDERAMLLAADNLWIALKAGVTRVRDLGARGTTLGTIRELQDAGVLAGARPCFSGPVITSPGGHGTWLGHVVATDAEIAGALDLNADRGADVIKIMMRSGSRSAEFREDQLRLAVEHAHGRGLPVAVHANVSRDSIAKAIESGADTIEHGYMLDRPLIREMARRGQFLCPTLSALRSVADSPSDARSPYDAHFVDWASKAYDRATEAIGMAHREGVRIIAGTDAGALGVGFDCLVAELRLLSECGLSALAALRSATTTAAQALTLGGSQGHPESDDWLLLGANPLDSLSALEDCVGVFHAGRAVGFRDDSRFDPAALPVLAGPFIHEDLGGQP